MRPVILQVRDNLYGTVKQEIGIDQNGKLSEPVALTGREVGLILYGEVLTADDYPDEITSAMFPTNRIDPNGKLVIK